MKPTKFLVILITSVFSAIIFLTSTTIVRADTQQSPVYPDRDTAKAYNCDNSDHPHDKQIEKAKDPNPPHIAVIGYFAVCINKTESPLGSIPQPDALKGFGEGEEGIGAFVRNSLGLLVIVAAILAFVFLVIGGISFVTAGGDKTKIEGARSKIVYAVVGLVVVFLAFAIVQFVQTFFAVNIFGEFDIPFI